MGYRNLWLVLNVSLGLVAMLLLLSLFDVYLPTLGKARLAFDSSEPRCSVEWNNEQTPLPDLVQCCVAARKQAHCIKEDDWVCSTGSSTARIHLNSKAYRYCQQLPIW